jgi:DNA-binding transcriptional LysR family regulator
MTGLTLRQLEVFTQVVELGSFRRCAEHIGISQVAVSEHVQALERRLGQPLFERHGGSAAKLTKQGERAYSRAKHILQETDRLFDDLASGESGVLGRRLTIGAPPFLMRYLQDAPAALAPDIELVLDHHITTPALVREGLARRDIDVGYFFALGEDGASDSTVVRTEPLAVFVSVEHPLARRGTISRSDLLATPAVHLPRNSPLRDLIDRAMSQAGLAGGHIALETDDYGLILTSVHRGLGYVCMFQAAENEVGQTSGLKRLVLEADLPNVNVREAIRPDWRTDGGLVEVVGILRRALEA